LFADETLETAASYAAAQANPSIWSHFARAHQAILQSSPDGAIQELNELLEVPGLETRVYLQAWSCLRALGQFPSAAAASEIRGIVVEVDFEQGLDLLAAYSDHTARYYNYSGAGIIWDVPDLRISSIIDQLLAAGQGIISQIGLWDGPRPPAPQNGTARLNLLTYGGLYFGQGEYELLASDPLGGPLLRSAIALMQALIDQSPA
jgi:hypothetical protein